MTGGKHELSPKRKRELEDSINTFKTWLCKKKMLASEASASRVVFPRPTSADWIMRVNDGEAQFNTFITAQCSFEFYRSIVLHECFHLYVQGLPNKSDAKRLSDDFGPSSMQQLDIEADYHTAMFQKDVDRNSLVDIFALYYEGSKIFGDPKIRPPKLARFIGTVLSVANPYFKSPRAKSPDENERFLPNIGNILTEESIHVLLLRNNHCAVREMKINLHDFVSIRDCYTGSNAIGAREYVAELLRFASNALQLEIPQSIFTDLYSLPSVRPIRSGSIA